MKRNDRLVALGLAVLLIAAAKLGQQLYRWYAYSEERREIGRLYAELEEAGMGVIRTQVRADTLRWAIARADEGLAASREELARYEGQLERGRLSRVLEGAYRRGLGAHNQGIVERNELFSDWRTVADSNRAFVDRYNLLADSIRRVAARMGEPYYPVPSPAEIASRQEARDELD
jgi:hypothetical protein